ncbi:MAG: hypothetical protein VB126_12580 [Paludibacter sp.]|nr:hypothetical protein [Paludibacter sp.]
MKIDIEKIFSYQIFKKSLLLLMVVVLCVNNAYSIDYYQRQSGAWNNPTTWTTESGHYKTVNTGTYPQAGDNVHLDNNSNPATITLTENAQCSNLFFKNSGLGVIAMGNFDLIVTGSWTVDWGNTSSITQGLGYLQVNGGIPMFNETKTIKNFRVGSSSFSFTQTNQITLTVSTNYDHNCFTQNIPTGIKAASATKLNATPCAPSLSATALTGFGSVCTGTTVGPNTFRISGLALTTANVTVSSLSAFSFSTTANGTYTNSLSLSHPAGNYSQLIYVKFSPFDPISYNGNIVVSGGGAANLNVAAAGSGAASVAPTVTTPTATNVMATTASLGGTIDVDGCASQTITERGVYYSTTNGFADGFGTKVSETGTFGTGTYSVNVAGLSANTTYYFKAFATNSIGTRYSVQGTFNNSPRTYYSRQTGNWTNPDTWTTVACGETINNGSYPMAGDNVVICQSHIITVNSTGLSCNNINMTAYLTRLILNNNFTINGNFSIADQSYVSVGTYDLTIKGNFVRTGFDARVEYSSGNVIVGGNISTDYTGIAPFVCTGTGWLVMTGVSKTFTTSNNNVTVPRFRQPATGFTKVGATALTISTTFDRNCGPAPIVSGGTFSPTGTTINATCYPNKTFRSATSGSWNVLSTWQQSTDNGANWTTPTAIPLITDGSVTIQSGHTVTLTANAAASALVINGVLNLATYSLNGTGTFTLASGATLKISEVSNFPTGFTTINLNNGSTVEYNRTGNQTISPRTYSHLSLLGSGVKTTNGVTVTGILSLQGDVTTSGIIVPNVASTIVRYNGASTQYLSDNFILGNKIYSMIVDNTANVVVNSNFTLNNQLTINNGGMLTINPQKSLIVLGSISNSSGTSGLVVKASTTLANGSLIFHNAENNPVLATVEMYSKATFDTLRAVGDKYKWQFFGVPVRSVAANPTFNGSYLRRMVESGTTTQNHWVSLVNQSVLTSFTGYEICQQFPTTYSIKGTLENGNFSSGQLAKTPTALFPGQHLFTNPYTAAIDIRALDFGSDTEATVYLYNAGTYLEWDQIPAGTFGTAAGQYTAVPKDVAGNSGLPRQVPSMGSMLVKVKDNVPNSTVNSYFNINYSGVMPNSDPMRIRGAENADYVENNENNNVVSTVIDVRGKYSGDKMWIFSKDGATRNFDNGSDGFKISGSALAPQIYAVENDGIYQIDAVADMNNTNIAFQAGQDTEYTMTFTHENTETQYSGIYLHDLVLNTVQDVTESGSTYTFTAGSTPKPVVRFKIIAESLKKNQAVPDAGFHIFNSGAYVCVKSFLNEVADVFLYDVSGRLVAKTILNPFDIATIKTTLHQVYIVKVKGSCHKLSKQIVVK